MASTRCYSRMALMATTYTCRGKRAQVHPATVSQLTHHDPGRQLPAAGCSTLPAGPGQCYCKI